MKKGPFDNLTPFIVQRAVEDQFGLHLQDSLFPYNSYVNRVFGVKDDEGREYVAKFYRPGRWSLDALEDEHDFMADCAAEELPVAVPLVDEFGETLGEVEFEGPDGVENFYFSLALKKGGRNFDAERDEDWLRLGRLLGRLHQVGREVEAPFRPVCTPEQTTEHHLRELLAAGLVHSEVKADWIELTNQVLPQLRESFSGVRLQRIHGDCHRGNILDRPGEGLLLMDFDDMMMGPVIQDLWLLLPGYYRDCGREVGLLSEGYQEFSPLDPWEWQLVEPLRFMRMVHFLAWTARQRFDRGFQQTFPDWGSRSFWIKELEDLRSQASLLSSMT